MRQKIVLVLFLLLALVVFYERFDWFIEQSPEKEIQQSAELLKNAYDARLSNLQAEGSGTVKTILNDDTTGARHQRFILELSTGQTVLISHNIDLAPRLENLKKGDQVRFFGEYEWNSKGGVIHWTHHDPSKKHADGWLNHNGRVYR